MNARDALGEALFDALREQGSNVVCEQVAERLLASDFFDHLTHGAVATVCNCGVIDGIEGHSGDCAATGLMNFFTAYLGEDR